IAVVLDVTDESSVLNGVQRAIEQFSCINILVNNAGIHCEAAGRPSTAEHFNRCLGVNLIGAWRTSQALLPHFRARGGGKIVNIASIDGRRPWAIAPAYSASKAALISLTQALAVMFGDDNINVNAVCPGGIMTKMADQFASNREAFQAELI